MQISARVPESQTNGLSEETDTDTTDWLRLKGTGFDATLAVEPTEFNVTAPLISIADLMFDVEGYPHPQWDVVADRLTGSIGPDRLRDAWADITRQWLTAIAGRLGDRFALYESDEVQLLAVRDDELADHLLWHSDYCRRALLDLFPGLARFVEPGKSVVMAYPDLDTYYAYLAAFHPEEGEFGSSAGVHIRVGYPHVAMCGTQPEALRGILAHEQTHAALLHLSSPAWVEEGVTQLVEQQVTGRPDPELTVEAARRHKRHWAHYGLGPFWWGSGFHAPGKMQPLSYQLAEVLMRLLLGEHAPGWFGLGRRKRDRLIAFLTNARASDAGQAAAVEHLGYTLGTLAAKFLGPGDWEPAPIDAPPSCEG